MEDQQRRVIDRAWQLQTERDKLQDKARFREELGRAAAEVGLDPTLLARAEADLAREDARARQRRGLAVGVALGVVLVVGVGLVAAWPASGFEDDFSQAARHWVLDKSRGTEAGVDYVTEGERGTVARVRVDRFVPLADGTYQVNLDRNGVVSADGLEVATFDVRGEGLAVTRLYLESGSERWRSPPVPITPEWTTHELPLGSFDHQVRQGGKWETTGQGAPGSVDTLSFKLGHYMNETDAHGEVRFDDLRLE